MGGRALPSRARAWGGAPHLAPPPPRAPAPVSCASAQPPAPKMAKNDDLTTGFRSKVALPHATTRKSPGRVLNFREPCVVCPVFGFFSSSGRHFWPLYTPREPAPPPRAPAVCLAFPSRPPPHVRARYYARAALRLGGVSPLGGLAPLGPRAKESVLLIRGFSLIPESDADSSRPQCFRFANFSRVFPKPALSSPASNELLRGHRLAAQEEPSERNRGVQTSGLIATDIALAGDAAVRSDVLSTVTRRRRVEVTTRLRRR